MLNENTWKLFLFEDCTRPCATPTFRSRKYVRSTSPGLLYFNRWLECPQYARAFPFLHDCKVEQWNSNQIHLVINLHRVNLNLNSLTQPCLHNLATITWLYKFAYPCYQEPSNPARYIHSTSEHWNRIHHMFLFQVKKKKITTNRTGVSDVTRPDAPSSVI